MDSEYDPEREAMAAIELASATHGADRQRWIGIAQAWLELARPPALCGQGGAEGSGHLAGGLRRTLRTRVADRA